MRVFLTALIFAGFAQPTLAQPSKLADDEPIVVKGLADGARVVEVDFDKVWKGCAECKRALAKLDKLAQNYRDEMTVAREFSAGPKCNNASPSSVVTFSSSSADSVGGNPRRAHSIADGLCAARAADQSRRTFEAVAEKYVVPEQDKLMGHLRSFLDQLAPHLRDATEAERLAHNASAGLTDARRTKLSAKNLKRIDVTQAVIRRLDATAFTIDLPDPAPPGPARGGYEPPKGKRR